MKKLILAALIAGSITLYAVGSTTANSSTTEQSQSQSAEAKAKAECEVNGYGKCTATAEASVKQEQRQKILAAQVGRKYHRPVDTAIDATTAAFIITAAFLGLGASVALAKIK